MYREQQLMIKPNGEFQLRTKLDLRELLSEAYEARQFKSYSNGKTMRHLMKDVPVEILERDPDGQAILYAESGSPEIKLAVRRFLQNHPEWKACSGSI
jgi:hypothetical protein